MQIGALLRVCYRRATMYGTLDYLSPRDDQERSVRRACGPLVLGCANVRVPGGVTPFESETAKKTYERIHHVDVHLTSHVTPLARELILNVEQKRKPCRGIF